jgi:hypothetical protein
MLVNQLIKKCKTSLRFSLFLWLSLIFFYNVLLVLLMFFAQPAYVFLYDLTKSCEYQAGEMVCSSTVDPISPELVMCTVLGCIVLTAWHIDKKLKAKLRKLKKCHDTLSNL